LVIEARRMAGFLFDIEDRVRRMAREAMTLMMGSSRPAQTIA